MLEGKGKEISYELKLPSLQPEEVKPKAPEFTVKIEDVQVKEGKPVKFVARATGEPAPTITWYHDHKPIKDSDIYKIRYPEEGESTLMLPEAFPEDTGVYTAKAANEVSEVECSATLEVAGMHDHIGMVNL